MKTIINIIIILCLFSPLSAVELKFVDRVMLVGGGNDDTIKIPGNFAVTEDDLYIVTDRKEGDIKIFNKKGEFVKRFGRKGHGPNEFITPWQCDYYNGRLIILDLEKRAFLLHERDEMSILKEKKILRSVYMGSDVAMMNDDKVLFDGFKFGDDKTQWIGYTYDFKTEKYNLLLKRHEKYSYDSAQAYENEKKDEINPIGFSGYCDWWGDYAYFMWLGDLKVFKINLKTKQIETFGKKTTNYRKPEASDQLKKAYKELDLKAWSKEIKNFSQVRGIWTNKNYVLVTYERVIQNDEEFQQRMIQFYKLDGRFINEMILPSNGPCGLFVSKDKDDNILYMYNRVPIDESDEDWEDERWQVTRFKMVE